ncbi:MAG TPA: SPFH domain-containing protein [Blastocatellia bacterium]|jgi:regulator of protease activity HflC (stomatin/prohibitin superfamily)|nr:SPFH domain-containing protein [Blastocatellia bacterium]
MEIGLFVLGFIALVVLITLIKSFRVVGQASVMIIERLGKFHKVASSGLNIIIPFVDKPRSVFWSGVRPALSTLDLREQLLDFPPQPVITRDNVTVAVDSVLYYQITDPIKSTYEVADLTGSIMQLTITAMRSIIGDLDLDHTFASRDVINNKLRIVLDEATDRWGVKVTRVEIRNIHPPEDIRVTMEKQMTAERNRRALILQADGDKQAAITRAEGEKQAAIARAEGEKESAILRAEGQAQARLRGAEAEGQAIRTISDSITEGQGNPAQYLLMQRYIESLTNMAGSSNAKVIFMPVETSAMLSSIGSLKEVFKESNVPEEGREKRDQLPPSIQLNRSNR